MTESGRPWDGITTGSAGPYSSEDWATIWKYMVGVGASRANVGPMLSSGAQPNNGLKVQAQSPAAAAVDVLEGSALVAGRLYLNTATVALTIAANASGNPRIDTVILRADYALQTIVLAVLQGTPAGSPTPPSLTQTIGTLYEIPLANVAVANAFVSISDSNITPRHEWANASPGVWLDGVLNNSGGTLATGDVVIRDTSVSRGATTTTTISNPLALGAWVGLTSNGGYGRVLTNGIGYVQTTTAVTRGDRLGASSTAKKAAITYGAVYFAVALETTSGAGLALCYIRQNIGPQVIVARDEKSSGTSSGTFTAGAWQTRVLNTLEQSAGALAALASNQITLQPGTYLVNAAAPGYLVGVHQVRLQNITDGTTIITGGLAGSSASDTVSINAHLFGKFTITSAKVIELQHRCGTTRTPNGFGLAGSFGTEVYAMIDFVLVGD